ncbi:MAG: DNA adenine methylase, partial [Alphaproteobacteria bacterium]|nr:DNA adenine methylase [Alphaproteobacteria bacterium]
KEVIEAPINYMDFDVGFATFFLNRTNRSGIIKNAGVIGGKNQDGNYKVDCRFNKVDLINRIKRVAKYKNRIHLTNQDAIDFMSKDEKRLPKETFFCIDPPYVNKGSSLYTNFYEKGDHAKIADAIMELKHPWILTYDNADEIKKLYMARRQFEFHLNYSVNTKRVGTEMLVASKGLQIPNDFKDNQTYQPQLKVA